MLEKTVAYVREFLGDPKNHDLLNHFESEVRNAKYEGKEEGRVEGRVEGRAEEKLNFSKSLIDAGVDKNIVAKCANLSVSELDKLLITN